MRLIESMFVEATQKKQTEKASIFGAVLYIN